MARPKKTAYISDSDLSSWFKLGNYAGLAIANRQKWAQLILDRANLRLLAKDPENLGSVRTLFEKLEKDPLCELGFTYQWKSGHRLDTGSVRSLTVSRMVWLLDEVAAQQELVGDVLEMFEAIHTVSLEPGMEPQDPNIAIDELLLPHENSFSGSFAHLAVDLRATDQQIKSDLRKWLASWRKHADAKVMGGDYTTKMSRWHQSRVLPYFDLRLYADIRGQQISREKFAQLLGFADHPSPKDLLDQLSKTAGRIISFHTFHALHGRPT
ncbi:hypothetical protein SAMN05446927_4298 [Caballeronia arationis]|uniref:Uncharacterized protein n=1 Tax=Caballeronia arationis TaxID=1777142 RepID=A0A7Z7N4D7_9BURK|nr:DUF6387 family protein [Caballeronia arationis]SOE81043.1 hypothetical protein SAMN05446927_4298 [Caballeronia arationis]